MHQEKTTGRNVRIVTSSILTTRTAHVKFVRDVSNAAVNIDATIMRDGEKSHTRKEKRKKNLIPAYTVENTICCASNVGCHVTYAAGGNFDAPEAKAKERPR